MGSFGSSGSNHLKPPSCGPKVGPKKTLGPRSHNASGKPGASSFKYDFNPKIEGTSN